VPLVWQDRGIAATGLVFFSDLCDTASKKARERMSIEAAAPGAA